VEICDRYRRSARSSVTITSGSTTPGIPTGFAATRCLAQIVGVVDTYEALTTPRPYQQAIPPRDAFTVLRQHVRSGWKREDLVETFISVVDHLHVGDAG
jgi:hypothetical protein